MRQLCIVLCLGASLYGAASSDANDVSVKQQSRAAHPLGLSAQDVFIDDGSYECMTPIRLSFVRYSDREPDEDDARLSRTRCKLIAVATKNARACNRWEKVISAVQLRQVDFDEMKKQYEDLTKRNEPILDQDDFAYKLSVLTLARKVHEKKEMPYQLKIETIENNGMHSPHRNIQSVPVSPDNNTVFYKTSFGSQVKTYVPDIIRLFCERGEFKQIRPAFKECSEGPHVLYYLSPKVFKQLERSRGTKKKKRAHS